MVFGSKFIALRAVIYLSFFTFVFSGYAQNFDWEWVEPDFTLNPGESKIADTDQVIPDGDLFHFVKETSDGLIFLRCELNNSEKSWIEEPSFFEELPEFSSWFLWNESNQINLSLSTTTNNAVTVSTYSRDLSPDSAWEITSSDTFPGSFSENHPKQIIRGDFDGDSDQDIIIASESPIAIETYFSDLDEWSNTGTDTVAANISDHDNNSQTTYYTMHYSSGDFDADGKDELLVVYYRIVDTWSSYGQSEYKRAALLDYVPEVGWEWNFLSSSSVLYEISRSIPSGELNRLLAMDGAGLVEWEIDHDDGEEFTLIKQRLLTTPSKIYGTWYSEIDGAPRKIVTKDKSYRAFYINTGPSAQFYGYVWVFNFWNVDVDGYDQFSWDGMTHGGISKRPGHLHTKSLQYDTLGVNQDLFVIRVDDYYHGQINLFLDSPEDNSWVRGPINGTSYGNTSNDYGILMIADVGEFDGDPELEIIGRYPPGVLVGNHSNEDYQTNNPNNTFAIPTDDFITGDWDNNGTTDFLGANGILYLNSTQPDHNNIPVYTEIDVLSNVLNEDYPEYHIVDYDADGDPDILFPNGRVLRNLTLSEPGPQLTQTESTQVGPLIFPNPFNSSTSIRVMTVGQENVDIRLFNSIGREVMVIYYGITKPGQNLFTIDGSKLSTGTYFVQLSSPGRRGWVKKITLVK